MTELQAKIILAYARHDMKVMRVAKEIYVTDSVVHYYFQKIKQETGLDPKKFYDLCRLVGIAASITGGKM